MQLLSEKCQDRTSTPPPGFSVAPLMHRGKHKFHFVLRSACIVLEDLVHANAIFADNLPVRIFELELVHAFVDPRNISWREFRGKGAARQRGHDEWQDQ
jgi:hypothetical protein